MYIYKTFVLVSYLIFIVVLRLQINIKNIFKSFNLSSKQTVFNCKQVLWKKKVPNKSSRRFVNIDAIKYAL